ncbi:MAG: FeS-binding protein [Actinobacteria bacterium]|nr:FeS-binding protein [Actinomycetota bacterium]
MIDDPNAATSVRLHVSFPEELVDRPMVYEMVKAYDVVPNIRRANVEAHSGWIILELAGERAQLDAAIAYLQDVGCTVNTMEGDVLEG